jgi:hypothetical protein
MMYFLQTIVVVIFFLDYYRWIEESLHSLWDFLLFVGIAILFKPSPSKKETKKFAYSQSSEGNSEKVSNEIELSELVDSNAFISRSETTPFCTTMSSSMRFVAPVMLIVHTPTSSSIVGHQRQHQLQPQPRPMFALAWREE